MDTGLDKPELAQHICKLLTEYRKVVDIRWTPETTPWQSRERMLEADRWWRIIRERLIEYESK